jgi:hypothetical protein
VDFLPPWSDLPSWLEPGSVFGSQISCPHWDFGSALIPTRAQLGLWAQLKIFYQPTLFCSGFVFPPHQGSVFLAASGDRSRSLFGGVTRVRSTESFFSLKP